jgi:hypothetical protein
VEERRFSTASVIESWNRTFTRRALLGPSATAAPNLPDTRFLNVTIRRGVPLIMNAL